ncbi:MAG TPA: hypothetical protein VMG11_11195 [Steroidobacteraceae bacterium]|nr:hypothetical protein [Steroidobacteraceae bacterium]
MRRSSGHRVGAWAAAALVLVALAGCSHIHWPWHHKPPPPPEVVHELDESAPPGSSAPAPQFPQYWKRNTLVIDLQPLSGSGSVVLRPRSGTTWPVRLALRVMPGSVGELEVRAAQRVILPVTASGTKPIDLELSPGVYTNSTEQIVVSWGPQA